MDEYTKKIADFEAKTAETNAISDKLDAEIRDVGKRFRSSRLAWRRRWKSCRNPRPS